MELTRPLLWLSFCTKVPLEQRVRQQKPCHSEISAVIIGVTCVDQDRGGYASYSSWEAGFQAWYELIRNYYIAQRGLTTVDTIIPTYAPTADHNDEAAYIASLKHAIDTWHAGILMP